ncbi:hypothetical protein SmJEL517_g04987 [Synchytrium microbalum]|uniref:Calcium uniporter protein, mitochondrial n=1 Tax=Synchytrium microbalum TaxID=1806994 RepID=A0A507BWF2_9FUNG|nr:uncharacterized protein SmJEL517_g04987 [Synchytrium microbalum]TPX31792.1 hypothetical protein SmJEL517_g04987 [Synchytrium microbalum]
MRGAFKLNSAILKRGIIINNIVPFNSTTSRLPLPPSTTINHRIHSLPCNAINPTTRRLDSINRRDFTSSRSALTATTALNPVGAGTSAVDHPLSPKLTFDERQVFLNLNLPQGSVNFVITKTKPVSDLYANIAEEYPLAKSISIFKFPSEAQWAKSTPSEDILSQALLDRGLILQINNERIKVNVPTAEQRTAHLKTDLLTLEKELTVLETRRSDLDRLAERTSQVFVWLFLAGMCAQWGLMLRLTFVEYSWDIMEPITYFLSYFWVIASYAFWMVFRRDQTNDAMSNIAFTRRQMSLYKRHAFDVAHLESIRNKRDKIKQRIEAIEREYTRE